MPIARIEERRRRSDAEMQALIEAVYQAQREALRVPDWALRRARRRPCGHLGFKVKV